MKINKTLFGKIFFPQQTICGCIAYRCQQKCGYLDEVKTYSEKFYLGKNYFGKFEYYYYHSGNYLSDIKIIRRNSYMIFHEQLLNNSEPFYQLKLNSSPILFQNIPDDLLISIKKKYMIN